jgi:uncharacterized membrane protein (DUF4010 family)
MKLVGTLLIGLAGFIALAAVLAIVGPALQARGMNVSGTLYPWPVWLVIGVVAVVVGLRLRRRGVAE